MEKGNYDCNKVSLLVNNFYVYIVFGLEMAWCKKILHEFIQYYCEIIDDSKKLEVVNCN